MLTYKNLILYSVLDKSSIFKLNFYGNLRTWVLFALCRFLFTYLYAVPTYSILCLHYTCSLFIFFFSFLSIDRFIIRSSTILQVIFLFRSFICYIIHISSYIFNMIFVLPSHVKQEITSLSFLSLQWKKYLLDLNNVCDLSFLVACQ